MSLIKAILLKDLLQVRLRDYETSSRLNNTEREPSADANGVTLFS